MNKFLLSLFFSLVFLAPTFAHQQPKPRGTKRPTTTKPATEPEQADSQALAIEKFNAGQDQHAAGKLAEALALYDEAIKLEGNIHEFHYQRGVLLLSLGRLDDAAGAFGRCVEIKPDFARGHVQLGEIAIRRNNFPEAEKSFLKAVELDGGLIRARVGAAQCRLARNAPKDALALLEPVANQTPPPQEPAFFASLGEAQRLTGNTSDALRNFTQCLMLSGNDPVARRGRARVYIAQKEYAKALDDLRAAFAVAPDATLAADLVAAYRLTGKLDEGIAFATEAVGREATNPALRAGLARMLGEAGRQSEAAEQWRRLTELEPNNFEWWERYADAVKTSDPAKSVTAYEKALELNPQSLDAQAGVAAALLLAKNFDAAIERFRAILSRDADNYAAHAGLATALYKRDQFPQAAEHFIWMVQRRPDVSVTYFFLGSCFDRIGDFAQALKAYEAFLEKADPRQNQLEIDKVRLRLPSLKRQLEQKGQKKK